MIDKKKETSLPVLVDALKEEISEIDNEISLLRNKRNTLMAILHAKNADLLKFKGKRLKRISQNRADISLIISDYLSNSSKEEKCSSIILHVKDSGFNINDSTLRTYLSYMREDGVIKPGSRKGYWIKT